MNKKGFTLIELVVSIVLVSVILVTLIGSLLQLRSAYSVVHENSDVIVYTSSISRVINSDINDNNGIKFVSCETDGRKCSIILGNDNRRELLITDNDKVLDDTDLGIEHSNNKTTLKYMDTTKYDKTNNENDKKLLYIRTLEIDKYVNETSGVTTTDGYGFYDMSATQYEYFEDESVNNIEAFTTITIRLLDGINMDVSKYDITLYGAGRYDYSNYVGRVYSIDLDNSEAETAGTTTIDEVFGVGFFVAESPHRKRDQITSIEIPTKGDKAFLGYYYQPYGVNVETKLIDAGGNIVASSRQFKNDVKLNDDTTGKVYAKWGDVGPGFEVRHGRVVQKEYTVTLNKDTSGKTCNTKGTGSYVIKYQNQTPDIEIPECAGYTFEGYLNTTNKPYHNRRGEGIEYYDIVGNSTFKASWSACSVGQYSLMADQTCTDCIKGSYAGSSASGSCTVCTNGKTTNGNKQASCNANCPNANNFVATWKVATWNENNTVTNECQIATCKTGYDGEISSNKCTVNTYKISFDLNGGKLDGVASPSTRRVDYDVVETINNPTRAGYAFDGWTFNGNTATAMHGSAAWTSQTAKTKDTTFKNLASTDEATVTLTANWSGCGPGYYNDGTKTTCTEVPAGYMSSGNYNTSYTACGGGKWSTSGSSSCSKIDAGCYGTSASSSCPNECSGGTYSKAGSSTCTDCSAGTYSGAKAESCISCGAGKWSSAKSTGCNLINAGCYGTSASSSCPNECAAGTYSAAGSKSCSDCSAGTYSDKKAGSCTPCGGGKWSNAGSLSCSNIDAGCYGTGASSACPTQCPAGTYSAAGSASCSDCQAGYYSGIGASSCTSCPSSQWSNAGASSCFSKCNSVTYVNGSNCTASCGGGTYNRIAYSAYDSSYRCSNSDQPSGGSACNTMSCCSSVTYVDGTTCSKPCGGGTYNRVAYSAYDGSRCTGSDTTTGGSSCGGTTASSYGEWSAWTPRCNPNSDVNASQSRERTVCYKSTLTGGSCGCSTQKEDRTAHLPWCCRSIDDFGRCTDWSSWGKCSKECGGGVQYRTRTCTQLSTYDGSNCGDWVDSDTRSCNTQACGGGGGGGCFLAGTKVRTLFGYKDIDKIEIGDYVLSYNKNARVNQYKKVTYKFIYEKLDEELYTVTFDDNTVLKLTEQHNVYIVKNNDLVHVAANKLEVGDRVVYSNGDNHQITNITHKAITDTVYNLEILDNHNFYILESEVLVHNQKHILEVPGGSTKELN